MPLNLPAPTQVDRNGKLCHLITLDGLTRETLESILDRARYHRQLERPGVSASREAIFERAQSTSRSTVATALLFCEPSTRTRASFELAAWKLGHHVTNLEPDHSSLAKSETIAETAATLEAMGFGFLVLRHGDSESALSLVRPLNRSLHCISGGTGQWSHPSQGLLDLFTVCDHFPELGALSVAIIGDIRHSRVARSTFVALRLFGVRDIRLCAPPGLEPEPGEFPETGPYPLDDALRGVKLVITLRLQRERMTGPLQLDLSHYSEAYGITRERLKLCDPHVRLMHPGPVMPGVELASELIESPFSLIREQVRNGVLVRMAIFEELAG